MERQNAAYRIKDLAVDERPRERLEILGAQSLTTAELLAILLRVGVRGENAVQVATRLLQDYGGLDGLHRLPFEEMCTQHGVGKAKAAQIKAALELANRLNQERRGEQPSIHNPGDAAAILQHPMCALEQEEMWIILLDTRNRVMRTESVYRGSLNSSQVRVGELFKSAVRRNAAAVIVAHNHPSGDPTPSPDDIAVTRAIIQGGKMLDIEVLDHLVIGRGSYVSLKERGLGFA